VPGLPCHKKIFDMKYTDAVIMTVLSSVYNRKECYPISQQLTPTQWKKNLQVNFLYCLHYSLPLIYQDENKVRIAFPMCKHLYLNKKHKWKSEKS